MREEMGVISGMAKKDAIVVEMRQIGRHVMALVLQMPERVRGAGVLVWSGEKSAEFFVSSVGGTEIVPGGLYLRGATKGYDHKINCNRLGTAKAAAEWMNKASVALKKANEQCEKFASKEKEKKKEKEKTAVVTDDI